MAIIENNLLAVSYNGQPLYETPLPMYFGQKYGKFPQVLKIDQQQFGKKDFVICQRISSIKKQIFLKQCIKRTYFIKSSVPKL